MLFSLFMMYQRLTGAPRHNGSAFLEGWVHLLVCVNVQQSMKQLTTSLRTHASSKPWWYAIESEREEEEERQKARARNVTKVFFRAHRTNDLTRKLEKVGPFECDELEKHCRVEELSNEYLLAKFGVDTAENESLSSIFCYPCVLETRRDNASLVCRTQTARPFRVFW